MRRSKQSSKTTELLARFEAEDRAVAYLVKFPPSVALATALSVEWSLATRWEQEQREMIRRGDPREVFPIIPKDMQKLRAARAAIPPGVKSDAAAEQHVIGLLADLHPDSAWWIAHVVSEWAKFENAIR